MRASGAGGIANEIVDAETADAATATTGAHAARARAQRSLRCRGAIVSRARARRGCGAPPAWRDQTLAVGARPDRRQHASRRSIRGARGCGGEARDGQAHGRRAADPIRSRRRRDPGQRRCSSCAAVLDGMRDRRNVRLHLVGHADTQPLSPALAAVFGDNEGLSRERAGEVAELLKGHSALPAEAISYEWAGDQQPVASNETQARPRAEPARRGRGLVRRGQARHGARRGARRGGVPSRQGLQDRRGLPAALRRRQRAAHARAERRRTATFRR